jgi:hypothetical protein
LPYLEVNELVAKLKNKTKTPRRKITREKWKKGEV